MKKVYYFYRLVTSILYSIAYVVFFVIQFCKLKFIEKIQEHHKGFTILLVINFIIVCIDGVICYVLRLILHKEIVKEKKEWMKQKNRAMMTKDHKGSIRIDTPPPNYSIETPHKS